ncbi:hypothetical protein OROGR_015020 [Orobanche gracilis]
MDSRIAYMDLDIEDINRIFLEVNPPDDRGCIYGLGSLGVALSATSTPVSKRDAEYQRLAEQLFR